MAAQSRPIGIVAAMVLAAAPIEAQQYTGTFTISNPQGGVVTLVLQQDGSGNVTGTMSGGGEQFTVEGMLEGGSAVGAIYNAQGGLYFEATLMGTELQLTLIGTGPDGTPNYGDSRQLLFTRQGAVVAGAPSAGNPLAGSTDPFAGTFAGQDIALTIEGGGGQYRGTLQFQGASYPIEATASGNRMRGTFSADGQSFAFEAALNGDELVLETGGTAFQLSRAGAAAPAANPLARGGAPAAAGGGAGLLGRWACQTGEGPARLRFISDQQLSFNGETSTYTLGNGVVRVMEEWGPVEYRYQLTGDQLRVTAPDGSGMQCQRQAQAAGGMEHLLQGQLCAYSSSPDGGFSTTRVLTFDGQGNLGTGMDTGISTPDVVGAATNRYGYGSYEVTGNTKGDEIYLTFPNGDTGVAYVYHVWNGTIVEVQFNGQVYAAGLCG